MNEACPKYLIYPEKIGIFEEGGEWRTEYHEGYNIDNLHASQLRSTSTDKELKKLEKILAHAKNTDKFEGDLRFRTL